MPLLDLSDCVMLVIDAQPGFYADADLTAPDRHAAASALERSAWLTSLAVKLGLPVVVTEEDASKNGGTDERITGRLEPGTPVIDKPTFAVTGTPAIMQAIRATGRRTAVLTGFETDICVAHSAVGLQQAGYRTVVVEDATFSPGEMH